VCTVLQSDTLDHLTFDEFLSFYHKLCGRSEVQRVFNQLYVEITRTLTHPHTRTPAHPHTHTHTHSHTYTIWH
jgi:hypothetical protein